ncbi:MAG: hypothetical protein QM785_08385 [Pyrinomonadaceae bacterium]
MKTIFRYTNVAVLTAMIFAAGALGTWAQDACGDAAGQTASYDNFLEKFKVKTIEGRKAFIEAAKQFMDKYGACDSAKENAAYFKAQIPKWEDAVKKMEEEARKTALVTRFDNALKAKNWDEVYPAGKDILAAYPEDFRVVEIVLAAVGGEEAFKANFKYNDDALRYAKASIADLEANKAFKVGDKERFGLSLANAYNFEFANRADAIAWMNLYAGYIVGAGQKNKAAAAPYLYKASQASASDAAKNPVSFELIGNYYFEELNKVVEQIQAKIKDQKDTDAADVAAKKVEDIKALVAMSNGISERAMDAFSRAFTLAKDPAYKAKMKKNVADAYKVRFAKETGVDEWIASAIAKPFVNPTTPVAPITDPEPTTTTSNTSGPGTGTGAPSGTGIGAANGTGIGAANGSGIGGTKASPTTTTAKPAAAPAKPASSIKPKK